MARVLCTLPHASGSINGVAFEPTDAGMLSEAVSDEVAALFTVIPGYELVEEPVKQTASNTSGTEGSGDEAAHQPKQRTAKRSAN